MSLRAFVKRVEAFKPATVKVSRETIATESSRDDQTRIDEMKRGFVDIIFQFNEALTQLGDVVQAGWDVLYDTRSTWDTPERLPVFTRVVAILCGLTSELHERARVMLPADLEKSRSLVFVRSWVLVVSTQLLRSSLATNVAENGLFIVRAPLTLIKRAGDYSYVRHLLMAQRASMVISKETVENFRVSQWKFSLTALWLSINRYGLTPSAGAMLEALFDRYALWLIHDPAEYEGKKEAELDALFDDWIMCRPIDDSEDACIGPLPEDTAFLRPTLRASELPINPRLCLGFIIQAENVFFHARRHHAAFNAHVGHPTARPVVLSERWRRAAAKAFGEFVAAVLIHSHIKTEAIETVKNLITRRHLLPGEAERAHFESGSVMAFDVDADGVLDDMRRDVFLYLQKDVLPLEVNAHFAKWIQELGPCLALPFTDLHSDDEWDRIAAARPVTERAAFLVFESAFDCLMKFLGVHWNECSMREFDYADDAGIIPPYDAPPTTPELAAAATIKRKAARHGTPAFLCLAHAYMVVVSNGNGQVQRVHVTPHLLDALGVWLAVCVKRETLRVSRSPILAKLHPVVSDPELLSLLV